MERSPDKTHRQVAMEAIGRALSTIWEDDVARPVPDRLAELTAIVEGRMAEHPPHDGNFAPRPPLRNGREGGVE
jgi:hypothetical protein